MSADELRFDGRIAIVTGAGAGLGREYALGLGRRGASVIASGRIRESGENPAARTAEDIVAAGGRAIAVTTAVGTPGAGLELVQTALDRFGRLDILVNNAAAAEGAAVETVLSVDVVGVYDLVTAAWEPMVEQGYGRIVNTTSNVGLFGMPRQTHHLYALAKSAMIGLTRNLAATGRQHGITANAIAPIAFTDRIGVGISTDYLEWMRENYPTELVSPVVLWLAHEVCSISGEILEAGGGRVSRVFLANTAGFCDLALSVESVGEHLAEIMTDDEYVIPRDNFELHAFGGRLLNKVPPPASVDDRASD